MRNPLAEPTTLGVATGAQLGITVTTLWAIPGALATQFAALTGACIVGALVFGVAWGKRLSPVTLILAGLVVSLYCGAINQLLVIFHHDQLQSMFFMEHRNANANRLERRAASVAAVAGRCDAHVIVVTPDDADGGWMTALRVIWVWRCR
ncbi:iron-hydroxamate transporter permease subunit [Salmonella enterica subsp. enterica serovar Daytona]|uniref:Iron-hydroxamate transporter permease subunit n=1 Tax=Salmonella enterica subsp. enterica serovar Daytona TaxID=1962639 RepID=A0A447JN31_SALET|nr:iron-hydroxamate transporter permease subunit [Salmonella enterica subsp. enterica serovar Daytona]